MRWRSTTSSSTKSTSARSGIANSRPLATLRSSSAGQVICVCVFICVVHVYWCVNNQYMHIRVCVQIHTYIQIHIRIYIFVCMYVCM